MTGLARIGEEVEDQFEPWALINREKHFGGVRGLDGERKWGREEEEGGREWWREEEEKKKMTLVCCKEFLNLRVVRTSATIWSISNPWATFALMKLKQDGVKGEEDGWWGRGWDACHSLRRAPRPRRSVKSHSEAAKKQSLCVHRA